MSVRILEGDALTVLCTLPDQSVQCCVTSPPYFGLRDYGVSGQLGLEKTPQLYVDAMVGVFSEVKRVLRDDGVIWVNVGDSYNGSGAKATQINSPKQMTSRGATSQRGTLVESCKPKDLIGIPWMLAFALRSDGWWLRQDVIWHKPNPMPESIEDRCTKAHEYVFLLSKSARYYFDADAIREPTVGSAPLRQRKPAGWDTGSGSHGSFHRRGRAEEVEYTDVGSSGRNCRSVWTISTQPFSEAHFATFPPPLAERCILAGSAKGQTVLDPFMGAGTTGLVAERLGRDCIGIELNPKYAEMARKRIHSDNPLFADVNVAPRVECSCCEGRGTIGEDDTDTCASCKGTGLTRGAA